MELGKSTGTSHRKALQYRGDYCLNCGQTLDRSDVYCPYCSQLNSTKHLSARDFFAEFLSSILVYDSRLRNTLKDLLFHPGRMSQNYVEGQRLKYANPFRFYLSVSIIYFLVQGLLSVVGNSGSDRLQLVVAQPQQISATARAGENIGENNPTENNSLAETASELPVYLSEQELLALPFFTRWSRRASLYYSYQSTHQEMTAAQALADLGHEVNFKNEWLYSRVATLKNIMNNPGDFVEYVTGKFPFFFFFFAPFFALFFLLLYPRDSHTYMEHLIFIFHIFSFVFLVLLLGVLPGYILKSGLFVVLLFLVVGPVYFFLALRRFYRQSLGITLAKFVILSFLFLGSFLVALGLFVATSLAVYTA